jgi:hypothetical protein
MENVGTFSKKMTYIGSLIGANIGNAHFFRTMGAETNLANEYVAYTGNRVNLYVMDQISAASRGTPADLKLGISVFWNFQSKVNGVGYDPTTHAAYNTVFREEDWNGVTPVVSTLANPVSPLRRSSSETEWFFESKIEYGAYCPGGLNGIDNPNSYQIGDMARNVYSFPKGSSISFPTGRNYVIPMVARGDFMFVMFWCDPPTWHASLDTDQVHIWALAGSDVAGSHRI